MIFILNKSSLIGKILLVMCIGMLTLTGSAVMAKKDPVGNGQVITESKLTMFHKKGNHTYTLRMGMLKKDLDKLLGKPEKYLSPDGSDYFKYDDIYAVYMGDRLAMISLGQNSYLTGGIKLYMSPAETIKKLGKPSLPNTMVYYYRWDSWKGKAVQLIGEKEVGLHKGRSDVYELRLSVNLQNEIYSIQIVRSDFWTAAVKLLSEKNAIIMPSGSVEPITMKDLSFAPQGKLTFVTIGMTRKIAEEIVGKPIDTNLFGIVYDGITISYRNDRVVSLSLRMEEDSKTIFKTPRGAGLLVSDKMIEGMYGIPSNSKAPYLDYVLYMDNKEGNLQVLKVSEVAKIEDKNRIYYISMLTMNSEDQVLVDYIMICDYQFAHGGLGQS